MRMSYAINNSLLHLLHRASQTANDTFMREAADAQVTPRQLAVLAAIDSNEGLSQTDIVGITGIDRSTMADIVQRLLKSNLISRQRTKADARAYQVKLTAKGKKALAAAAQAAIRTDARLVSALPVSQRESLLRLLQRLVDASQQ